MFLGKKILAIGAHPDDIEYGTIGTLLKYQEHSSIFCHIQTVGGINDETSDEKRCLESNTSLEILKLNGISFGRNIGISQERYPKYVKEIESILDMYEIDLVLAPSIHDTHQDHRLMHHISMSALRRRRISILFYTPLSLTPNFSPNIFVDITRYINLKREALKAHKSQCKKHYMTDEYIETFNRDSFAALHGLRYSEKFEIGRCFF